MATDTRRAMVLAAVALLRERGTDGVTLDDVLARSGAPRGSIYHHFPGGRAQILNEAAQLSGDAIAALITRTSGGGPAQVLDAFVAFWRKLLTDNNFSASCPAVSITVSTPRDSALAKHAEQIFHTWHSLLADCFETDGLPTDIANRLATMSLAAIEGAVTMCRAQASMQPLEDVATELEVLVAARSIFAATPH